MNFNIKNSEEFLAVRAQAYHGRYRPRPIGFNCHLDWAL